VLFDIPDLRVFPDPYIGIEADKAKGAVLARRLNDLTFEELVHFYYENTPAVSAQQAQQFTRGLMSGAARSRAAITSWESEGNTEADHHNGPLLDVGCGTAPLLSVLGDRYRGSAGVDIAFRWLIVAKKRLMEANVDLPLICACAEALPFRSGSFNRVVADSALEHFRGQVQALREIHRVLRPGGFLSVSTPNRYSVGPDPHLDLWAGGYLPTRLINRYALVRGTVPPKRRLLSSRSLRRQLRAVGFENVAIDLPDVAPGQRDRFGPAMRQLIGLYQTLKSTSVTRRILFTIGPLLLARATKPLPRTATTGPTPTIRTETASRVAVAADCV
jgi:ubiquinone/menaquinone biosynthesis C-methylase UbiE